MYILKINLIIDYVFESNHEIIIIITIMHLEQTIETTACDFRKSKVCELN